MHRNLFGIAAILAAGGYFVQTLSDAEAQSFGPVISAGEAPWKTFTGNVLASTSEVIYTVPSDQIFVLTGICLAYASTDVYQDSTLKIEGGSNAAYCSSSSVGMLGLNNGHVVFEPGTELIIETDTHQPSDYMIQGYLAHP